MHDFTSSQSRSLSESELTISPLMFFETHMDTVSFDLLQKNIERVKSLGYSAICFEESTLSYDESIQFHLQRVNELTETYKVLTGEHEVSASPSIKEMILKTYGSLENLIAIRDMHLKKAAFRKACQTAGIIFIGMDSYMESYEESKLSSEIFETHDYDNPLFLNGRNKTMAIKYAEAIIEYNGGVIGEFGACHFGVQKKLCSILGPKHTEIIKSFYIYSKEDQSPHTQGLINEEQSCLERYPLGIKVQKINPDDLLSHPGTIFESLFSDVEKSKLKP